MALNPVFAIKIFLINAIYGIRTYQGLLCPVSGMSAHSKSATSVLTQIALLSDDLSLLEAHDPETRIQIPTILGILKTNCDAGTVQETWFQIGSLPMRAALLLPGIDSYRRTRVPPFLLHDMATAKKAERKAWMVADEVLSR
jgi:hypothetical protein